LGKVGEREFREEGRRGSPAGTMGVAEAREEGSSKEVERNCVEARETAGMRRFRWVVVDSLGAQAAEGLEGWSARYVGEGMKYRIQIESPDGKRLTSFREGLKEFKRVRAQDGELPGNGAAMPEVRAAVERSAGAAGVEALVGWFAEKDGDGFDIWTPEQQRFGSIAQAVAEVEARLARDSAVGAASYAEFARRCEKLGLDPSGWSVAARRVNGRHDLSFYAPNGERVASSCAEAMRHARGRCDWASRAREDTPRRSSRLESHAFENPAADAAASALRALHAAAPTERASTRRTDGRRAPRLEEDSSRARGRRLFVEEVARLEAPETLSRPARRPVEEPEQQTSFVVEPDEVDVRWLDRDMAVQQLGRERSVELALELVARTIERWPAQLLVLTGAGVEVACLEREPPGPCAAHRVLAKVRELTDGEVGHVTTNISGLQLYAESPELSRRNLVCVHRTIYDGVCSRRSCAKMFRPRSHLDATVPARCDCGKPVVGCVPETADRASDDWGAAADLAAGRQVLLVLGNSLRNETNGTGLKWMEYLRVKACVVVNPTLPETIGAERHLLQKLQSAKLAVHDSCLRGTTKTLERFIVVRETADAFLTRLAGRLNLGLLDRPDPAHRRFPDTHRPPPLPDGYSHKPTLDVLARFLPPAKTIWV